MPIVLLVPFLLLGCAGSSSSISTGTSSPADTPIDGSAVLPGSPVVSLPFDPPAQGSTPTPGSPLPTTPLPGIPSQDPSTDGGDPSDDSGQNVPVTLTIDCTATPEHQSCQEHETAIGDACALAGGQELAGEASCLGRKWSPSYDQCQACLTEHGGSPIDCAPCANRSYGFLTTETLDQVEPRPGAALDVLWVFDNSPSMVDEQTSLATNIPDFLQALDEAEVEYRLAVTLTDPTPTIRGHFVSSVITPGSANPTLAFRQGVELVTTDLLCSSDQVGADCYNEQGLSTAVTALAYASTETPPNQGFLRPEADLAVIFVSDSDDMTQANPTRVFEATGTRDAQIDILLAAKSAPAKVTLSALVADGSEGCSRSCWLPSAQNPSLYQCTLDLPEHDNIESVGTFYLEAVRRSGGLSGPLCSKDFKPFLSELGARLTGASTSFPLAHQPISHSVAVWVDSVLVPPGEVNGWRVEGSALQFHGTAVPPVGATLQVRYYREEP